MITLRKARERHHHQRRKQEGWLTFHPRDRADALASGFGALQILSEDRLPPGRGIPQPDADEAEIVTYVREGALAYGDSLGRTGVIHAGEFQRMTSGNGIRHSETNVSRADWAHVFQIWLRPPEPLLEHEQQQKRFSSAERRGGLCVIASPDARRGSLRIYQDALLYSAMLDPGQHIVHELWPGRRAWLHIVEGEITLGDLVLGTGDGAGFAVERAVSLTAREGTEILLLDLGKTPAELAEDLQLQRAATTVRPGRSANGVKVGPDDYDDSRIVAAPTS